MRLEYQQDSSFYRKAKNLANNLQERGQGLRKVRLKGIQNLLLEI